MDTNQRDKTLERALSRFFAVAVAAAAAAAIVGPALVKATNVAARALVGGDGSTDP